MQSYPMLLILALFVATTSSATEAPTKNETQQDKAPTPPKNACDDGRYKPEQTNKYAQYGDADRDAYVRPECPVDF